MIAYNLLMIDINLIVLNQYLALINYYNKSNNLKQWTFKFNSTQEKIIQINKFYLHLLKFRFQLFI